VSFPAGVIKNNMARGYFIMQKCYNILGGI
ncbi:unnamed protein product, partial [marine sediment metagenome]